MRDLAIYGAGGFGRETALMIEQINSISKRWNMIGFYDDKIPKNNVIDNYPVLGGLSEAKSLRGGVSLALAIADPVLRENLAKALQGCAIEFPSLVHPAALIGSAANRIGEGCIITAGCILTTGIVMEDFCIINLAATIGHDVRIGRCTTVMPGCNISGNVSIGSTSMIGTGVQILQNLTLGQACKVGAGAVVTKSFGERVTIVGIPAKEINHYAEGI